MKSFIFFVATVVFTLALLFSSSRSHALQSVPSFELNLDLPASSRWNGAVQTIVSAHGWEHSFGPVLDLYLPITYVIPQKVIDAFNSVVQTRFPDNYQEALGIYQQLVQVGQIDKLASQEQFIATFFSYEILHAVPQDIVTLSQGNPRVAEIIRRFQDRARAQLIKDGTIDASFDVTKQDISVFFKRACTGILSLPTNLSADILHLRNMDEQPSPARNLTLKITATRGGKVQFEALDWLWFAGGGVQTSQRFQGVTLEMNYRDFFNNANSNNFTWDELIARVTAPNVVPVLLFQRVVHERKLDYTGTITFATEIATYAAPFYVVMSGTQRRGAVLTLHPNQNRSFVAVINDTFNYHESDGLPHVLVQTNYDILNGAPDNAGDDRRTVALNTLRMLGRERSSTELGVWMALNVYPVHNRGTFYTAILSVSKPIEGYIRRQMIPDPQFPI
jgi:hypothetical protein